MKHFSLFVAVMTTSTFLCSPAAKAVDYEEKVYPILKKKCFKCHSGPRSKGDLRMDQVKTFATRLEGDHAVIVPGDAATSLLVEKAGLPRTDSNAMPPPTAQAKGAERMTDFELNIVKEWINSGAKFEASESGATDPADATADNAPAEPATDALHDWVNFEGKSIKAAFVRLDGEKVVIRMGDGKEIPYPLSKLNADSQALAKKLGGG